MSCTSNGCRLTRPGEPLAAQCIPGCRVEIRRPAPPAPPPEPPASAEQVGWQDSMFDVPPEETAP